MNSIPLTEIDQMLIKAAEEIITKYYKYGRHHLGTALLTTDGKIYTALHLETNVGRVAVCGEVAVISKAMSEGSEEIDTIVSVRHPKPDVAEAKLSVVSPCGICRELILDYGPGSKVILDIDGQVAKYQSTDLLPYKYRRSTP